MAKRVFLDTNIIIDILGMRSNFASAATVLQMGVRKQIELYITNITVANAIYVLRKDIGKARTLELIKKLCNIVHVAPSGENELYRSFEIESPDFEDILQYSSAITVGAEVLLTRNDKHFRFSSIAVMDCETFINSL